MEKKAWNKKIRFGSKQIHPLQGVVAEDGEGDGCEGDGDGDLRGDADLGNEKELVEFFNSVMGRRKEKEWN